MGAGRIIDKGKAELNKAAQRENMVDCWLGDLGVRPSRDLD